MPEETNHVSETEYVLGQSDRETRGLIRQAALLQPITERLLRGAGIRPGLRVLDLGCGAGDVSLLAAALVGDTGSVVGIDRNAEVLAVARRRAIAARFRHVDFRAVPAEVFADPRPFDLVIGRYVLIHQADPVAFLRRTAGWVRPGGVVAFHELCMDERGLESLPAVPLWRQAGEWIRQAFQAVALQCDAGGRLIEYFARAGLPEPALFCECPVGGGADSPVYAWVANTVESLLPHLVRARASIAIETLEERLRDAVIEARSQVVGPAQFCAWTRVRAPRMEKEACVAAHGTRVAFARDSRWVLNSPLAERIRADSIRV